MRKLTIKFFTVPSIIAADAVIVFVPVQNSHLPTGVYCCPDQNDFDVYNYKSYVNFAMKVKHFILVDVKLNGVSLEKTKLSSPIKANDVLEIEIAFEV